MTTTAIQARHAHNLLRLARVNAALSAWSAYEANQLPAPDLRRPLPRLKPTRGGLKELQLMLVQRIGQPEQVVGVLGLDGARGQKSSAGWISSGPSFRADDTKSATGRSPSACAAASTQASWRRSTRTASRRCWPQPCRPAC